MRTPHISTAVYEYVDNETGKFESKQISYTTCCLSREAREIIAQSHCIEDACSNGDGYIEMRLVDGSAVTCIDTQGKEYMY